MCNSITLIGMAGAGKTSVGKVLSSRLDKRFIDSDHEIERELSMTLQDILIKKGKDKFLEIEKQSILNLKFDEIILATGGSVIFSEEAMRHICKNSSVFYLKVKFEKILERVGNFDNRGFIKDSDQTFEQAFRSREHLYEKYADHIICNEESPEVCIQKIEELLEN